ncbi:MAG: hypothetical protein IJL87_04975 [Clostridia bacterium]|nr:hypothetical protein [Clostridia bacterium]
MIKKLVSVILSALFILSLFTACKSREEKRREALEELYGNDGIITDKQDEEEDEDSAGSIPTTFALPYSGEDSFNPYLCTTTINNTVCDLVFDSLVKVNQDYTITLSMAKSVSIEGSNIVVELAPSLLFSDGSAVTVYDIVYSCNSARLNQNSHFYNQLASIIDCRQDGHKVYFTLSSPDCMADRLLDFPIIKRNSDTIFGVTPIGSGRYKFAKDNTGTYLALNPNWYGYSALSIAKIRLLEMPTLESIIYSVEIGTLSFFFSDLSENNFTNINAISNMVDLNNLVFLGINTNNGLLSQPEIRTAISCALDRDSLAIKAYTGRALAATGPFTPNWDKAQEYQKNSTSAQKSKAESYLDSAGYVNVDQSGIRYNGNGRKLEFKLLISSENPNRSTCAQLIQQQLAAVGISVTIQTTTYEKFVAAVEAGNYQMYLGEYPVKSNMDISDLIGTEDAKYTYYHGSVPYTLQKSIKEWRQGTGDVKDIFELFDRTLPFIPVVYRQGLAIYTRTLKGSLVSTESDLFLNLSEWSMGG